MADLDQVINKAVRAATKQYFADKEEEAAKQLAIARKNRKAKKPVGVLNENYTIRVRRTDNEIHISVDGIEDSWIVKPAWDPKFVLRKYDPPEFLDNSDHQESLVQKAMMFALANAYCTVLT